MKKIKYLSLIILSLLGIGFSFGENIHIGSLSVPNIFSFEGVNNNLNIHYGSNLSSHGHLYYFGSNSSLNTLSQYSYSLYKSFGYYLDDSYVSTLLTPSSNGFVVNDNSPRLGLLMFKPNSYGSYNANFLNYYVQYTNLDSTGGIVNFTNVLSNQVGVVQNSYTRFFYNPNDDISDIFWTQGNYTPSMGDISTNPYFMEMFRNSNDGSFLTNNGKVYIPGLSQIAFVSPGYSYGFGLVPGTETTWSNFKFYTVFPYFDSFQSKSSYILPSWAYTDDYFMFRVNGEVLNSSSVSVGVLQKCTPSLCGTGYYTDVIFSRYVCNFPGNGGLTIDTSSKYINIKENCVFQFGGLVKNFLGYSNTTESKFPFSSFGGSLTTPFITLNFNSSQLILKYTNSYNGYTIISSKSYNLDTSTGYDILGTFSNNNGGGSSSPVIVDTNYVGDVLDTICKSSGIKPPYCNDGVDSVGTGLDGFRMLSGDQLVYVIIDTSTNDFSDVVITPNGSGSWVVDCNTENDYFCSITSNLGSNQRSSFGSGFILSTGYYTDFFIKTGYRAKCPYPYTDLNIGLHNKVLNKVYNALNFDIFLPINCSIAAFTAGRNFQFLKDVNLGLNPLMGNIQGLDDPRNYLYGFFDFLLSLALFFFLMKIYKFFK